MATVTVSPKYQIVIPKPIRDALGFAARHQASDHSRGFRRFAGRPLQEEALMHGFQKRGPPFPCPDYFKTLLPGG